MVKVIYWQVATVWRAVALVIMRGPRGNLSCVRAVSLAGRFLLQQQFASSMYIYKTRNMKLSIFLSASLIAICQSPSLAQTVASSACAPLHMIVARASTEPQGEGIIGAVAQAVQKQISDATAYAVVYPATLGNYVSSETKGTAAMTEDIEDYVKSCPSSKIALLGYSQGAQVVGNTICGTSESAFPNTTALAAAYGSKIVAIIQMGDPSFVPGLPWDVGTAKTGGIFPRQNTTACDPFSSRIQSYCDHNDFYCDSGTSILVHLSYISLYQTAAVNFIVEKYNSATGNSTMSSSTSDITARTTSSVESSSRTSSATHTSATASSSSSNVPKTTGSAAATPTSSTATAAAGNSATASAASSSSTAGSNRIRSELSLESWIVAAICAFAI